MCQWLYPVQFNLMADEVFKDARLGRFVAWIQSIVANFGISLLFFFQPFNLFIQLGILLIVRRNLRLNQTSKQIKVFLGF